MFVMIRHTFIQERNFNQLLLKNYNKQFILIYNETLLFDFKSET